MKEENVPERFTYIMFDKKGIIPEKTRNQKLSELLDHMDFSHSQKNPKRSVVSISC